MMLSLFDLHCDTAYEMLRQKQPLSSNNLAVSLQNAEKFEQYVQIMALWTDPYTENGAGWKKLLCMLQNLQNDLALQSGKAILVNRFPAVLPQTPILMLSIEDARILDGCLDRVDKLFELGVRIVTPLWKGHSCIGGAHDTNEGLTDFGRKALIRALEIGMILDVSHASERSAEEIFVLSESFGRPVIATHSNAHAVCPVSRNLRDWQIQEIVKTGGVIGLNLYGPFLRSDGNAVLDDVFPHIARFLQMGCADALCLGCDMDGCQLPPDIPDLSALPRLFDAMKHQGYPDALIHKIFFENAQRFAVRFLS